MVDGYVPVTFHFPHMFNNFGGDLVLHRGRLGHLLEESLLRLLFDLNSMLMRRFDLGLEFFNKGTSSDSYMYVIIKEKNSICM